MNKTKRTLFRSVIALILCFSMLIGTTFAWFTDSVTSGSNIIQSGNLNVEMYWTEDLSLDLWHNAEVPGENVPFDYDKWEPGYTEVRYVKIVNAGNLALKYDLTLAPVGAVGVLAEVIGVHYAENVTANIPDRSLEGMKSLGWLKDAVNGGKAATGSLEPGQSTVVAIALHMDEDAGNEYQNKSIGDGFVFKLLATQFTKETDSFGPDYDQDAQFPVLKPGSITVDIAGKVSGNALTEDVTVADGEGRISAIVPAGTKVEGRSLTLSVSELSKTGSNVILTENEILRPLDVHIEGVAEDNSIPILVTIEEAMMTGLNIGNYTLYHVEDGATNAMTAGDLTRHNGFTYDPTTGDVTLALATFSEVAMVAEESKWEGNFDYSWYTNAVAAVDDEATTTYTIANADQLAAFGAIVGGMAEGIKQDSFKDKTVKLISDINLGDDEANNVEGKIFHPIGYYYTDDKNADGTTGDYYSTVNSFEGTFDGQGHTISNFYQNTWEIKGDYDGNYYKDAMGLFGYVKGGTVKNLTVDGFSSDGEFTPTGVIAAYADGNATFENIAITNCNPRVYNTGNGGIIGIAGSTGTDDDSDITLKNITVDNSNKISALWGSWDVACGGLVGMYRGNVDGSGNATDDTITFTNCHVAAQIDVYNDVCANYQYYAYRYSGMIIGSVRHNTTNDEGKTIPNMTGISATGCTVNYGDWNDYYYCEFEKNTKASYTHDYQFSRVPVEEIIFDEDGNVTGCTHNHKDHNGDGVEDTEVINGETVYVEDKTAVHLPFTNLFTGYGWGVNSVGLEKYSGIVTNLDITEGDQQTSDEKFVVLDELPEIEANKAISVGDLFAAIEGAEINNSAVQVAVSALDSSGITAKYSIADEWENGTLTFESVEGLCIVTIQDYNFCKPTVIVLSDGKLIAAIESKFTGNFLYRVGNKNEIALDSLFTATTGVPVDNVAVTIEQIAGDAEGEYTPNAVWTMGKIQFTGTGVVKVTIKDDTYCTPTELILEVVDAWNATTATNATANNVVLLNDIVNGFTVSGEYTFFGNGFTLNYTGDGRYLNNGLKQGLVTVSENGTLDNLHIKASIYPTSYLYYEEAQKGPSTVEGEKTRYHYQLSAVVAKGNATIANCYIYGARTNVFVDAGNVTIKDSVLECGTLANIQIQSSNAYTVTLENVTTIQHQVNATIGDTTAVMLGAGVIVGPDTTTNPTIVLNGKFKQYNWVTADDKEAVNNSTAKTIIQTALDATAFNHTVNDATASNLGIIFMNEATATVNNNTGLPYTLETVSMLNQNGQVYSLKNATADQIYCDYENADRTTVNGDYLPTFDFDLGDQLDSNDGNEDNRYLYGDKNGIEALYQEGYDPITLNVDSIASIYKYTGIPYPVTAKCLDANGNELTKNNGVVTLDAKSTYTLVFTVTDNIFYDKDGNAVTKSVERIYTVPLVLDVKAADIKNAEVNIKKEALDGVYNTVNLNDYELRINFLDCISITDYDNKGTATTVELSSNISSATLTPSGANVFTTAFTVTITYTDGRVLTVNFSKISGSSPGTKTGKVNTSGSVYFTTEGALNNKPTETSSQNVCTITSVSFKGNSGSTITNDTVVTVTWELGSSDGCVTPDTLITLADGTQKRVDELTFEDKILAWDFFSGTYVERDIALLVNHGEDLHRIANLRFSDGSVLRIIADHGVFDYDLNKFVYITVDNMHEYVGHRFVQYAEDGGYNIVTLTEAFETEEYTSAWSITSADSSNAFASRLLTVAPPEDFYNWIEMGGKLMYDAEQFQKDVETYGLYTYEDFKDYVTYEQFVDWNGAYLKIAVEKGYFTFDYILELIELYKGWMPST